MSNETMINPINNSNSTVINSELQPNNATVINTEISNLSNIAEGVLLCDKYKVESKLDINTGEADLYVCDFSGEKFIAKIYRRKFAVKPEVTNILKEIDSPYIAKLYETGTINGMPFEILPYYKNGSVQGRKFTYEELKNNIIPCINAGLKALHDKEIIHKDLKPSNIMLCDNGKDVAIIDFGISSVLEDGNTIVKTKTGMTPEYSAPETFRSLFLEESDYYSFGVTVCEMFCGYSPYAKMSQEEIEQYVSVQRIPIPKDMPSELSDFVNALTYYDITNRRNKNNPNRRWTYDEVRNWCEGRKQIIPGEGIGNSRIDMPPYNFNDKDFTDINSLVKELAFCWSEGKKDLFRGYLSSHFLKNSNQKLARICSDAEDDAKNGILDEDAIFWKTLYRLAPEMKTFYWNGKSFESLSHFGRVMLEKLSNNDDSDYEYYKSILSKKILTCYAELHSKINPGLLNAAKNIEDMFLVDGKANIKRIFYMMAYMLSGEKVFRIEDREFVTVDELAVYIKSLIDESYDAFRGFCDKLIDNEGKLLDTFEYWLLALGKNNEIEPILNKNILSAKKIDIVFELLEKNATINSETIATIRTAIQIEKAHTTDVVAISTSSTHTVGLKSDGTVIAVGDNMYGECDVSTWKGIIAVSTTWARTVGLKENGTVVAIGETCNDKRIDVSTWRDIVAVDTASSHIIGLKKDGTVVATGYIKSRQCEIGSWSNIKAVATSRDRTIGLKEDGTVVLAGEKYDYGYSSFSTRGDVDEWNDIISIAVTDNYTMGLKSDGTVVIAGNILPHNTRVWGGKIENWKDITAISASEKHAIGLKKDGTVVSIGDGNGCKVDNWKDVVAISVGKHSSKGSFVQESHSIGIKADGRVISAGDNEYGPSKVSFWKGVSSTATGDDYTVGLKANQRVVAVGDNSNGQCNVFEWKDIISVSAGLGHTVGLKSNGTVVATGLSYHGQCNVTNWNDIVKISTGMWTTFGLKKDGTVVAVGNNREYQCNVAEWRDIIDVAAGATHTVGLKSDGTVVAVGDNSNGQCDVNDWCDIVAIKVGYIRNSHYEYIGYTEGLKADGTMVSAGKKEQK